MFSATIFAIVDLVKLPGHLIGVFQALAPQLLLMSLGGNFIDSVFGN